VSILPANMGVGARRKAVIPTRPIAVRMQPPFIPTSDVTNEGSVNANEIAQSPYDRERFCFDEWRPNA
jgi:hypothetical protein